MRPNIDESAVRQVAKLARLDISDADVTLFAAQLGRILEYVQSLESVDTAGVEPLYHPLALENVLREDEPALGLSSAQALANAPQREHDFFRVPAVLDPHSGA